MATEEKPATKFQIPDWYTDIYQITRNSQIQRDVAHRLRQEARFLRNESDSKAKWDQYDTNCRFQERVEAKRKWIDLLEETLLDLNNELKALNDEKNILENQLEMLNVNTDVNMENLTIRDGRIAIENTLDGTEIELKKEQATIKRCKLGLQQMISRAFEQIQLLLEAKQQVTVDLEDKNTELNIDIDCYNLNDLSPLISYKPFVPRRPKNTTTPQQWEDFSRYNVDRALTEIESAKRLRNSMHDVCHGVSNDLDAQKNATDFAWRKRVHELEKAKDELEWQKKNMEDEIEALNKDLHDLEEAINAKIPKMKKAETRLEWRTWRPNVEMCWDAPHVGLIDELKQLNVAKEALQEKRRQLRHCLDNCEKQLYRINDDLAYKNRTLELDTRCQQSRDRLTPQPVNRSDCNLMTQGILKRSAFN